MLILGEQSTIDKLNKLANSLIAKAKHHEEIASQARDKAAEIYELAALNAKIHDGRYTLLWAEQEIRSMEFMEKAVAEAKSETN